MLRIPVEHAKSGMVVATPVFHPDAPEHVLLRAGYPLDAPVLGRLRKLGVRQLWVKYPSLESIERRLSPELLRRRSELAANIRDAFGHMQNESAAKMEYQDYRRALAQLIEYLLSHPASMICMDDMTGGHTPLMQHALAVSYMSVMMGLKLDAYLIHQRRRLDPRRARQINSLGLGAMLHDIGLTRYDPKLLAAHLYNPLHDLEDDADWQQHARMGYEMLHRRLEPTARAVILHHHQHHDGSGFPKQLVSGNGEMRGREDNAIHVFSRIVCVADVYNRLRRRPDGSVVEPVEAIGKMVREPLIHWFDPIVLQMFLRITPPYPPGVMVVLNDGRKAAVIEHHAEQPCRPTVQWLDQPTGDGERDTLLLDLREHDELHVAEAGGVDVAKLNFELPANAAVNEYAFM